MSIGLGVGEDFFEVTNKMRAVCSVGVTMVEGECDYYRVGNDYAVVAHDGNLSWFADADEERTTRVGGEGNEGVFNAECSNVGDHCRAKAIFWHSKKWNGYVEGELKKFLNE